MAIREVLFLLSLVFIFRDCCDGTKIQKEFFSDGAANGHGPRFNAAIAAAANRKEFERFDRPGALVVRGFTLFCRSAFENSQGQGIGEGLFTVRL